MADSTLRNRWGWFVAGWAFVAVGAVGLFLPVLPTTPFLLLAAWAFSRSSRRFHEWLLDHRLFGPPVRRWQRERVIPARVKAFAIASMLASFAWLAFGVRLRWYALAAVAVVIAAGVAFLVSVPSRPRSQG